MALSQSVEAQSTSQTSDTWSLGGRLLTRLHNGLERLGLYGHNSTSSLALSQINIVCYA